MQAKVLLPGLFLLVCQFSLALPDFTGFREDDSPVFDGYLSEAHTKNLNVGVADIQEMEPGPDEMLIRIYAGFGIQPTRIGGHPLDLKEIRVKDDVVTMLWYPACPGRPETTRTTPDNAWRILQEQNFFTIRDSRTFPDYPGMLDGITYLIQIKTVDTYREFTVSNPQDYESEDNERLLTTLRIIEDEFDTPGCYAIGP